LVLKTVPPTWKKGPHEEGSHAVGDYPKKKKNLNVKRTKKKEGGGAGRKRGPDPQKKVFG